MWTILLKIAVHTLLKNIANAITNAFRIIFYPLYAAVKLFHDQVSFWCSIQVNLWIDCQCPAVVELSICFLFLSGRTFVKRYALYMLSDRCLSVSVSVLDTVCDVSVLWPNGWMDQDATCYGGRPRHRRHCSRWGPSSPTERGTAAPNFSADVYCGQTLAHLSNCWALVHSVSKKFPLFNCL